ncbi:MAG: histidine kinase, partial [Rhodocyclaceae bacterium]|nr:histidine kinase [Rhodocyclaceae bacterium]
MKIKTKISLAIGVLLALSMAAHSYTSWRDIRAQSLRALEHEAENVRGILMATRRVYQLQFLASGLPVNEKTVGFLPAHALSRIAA